MRDEDRMEARRTPPPVDPRVDHTDVGNPAVRGIATGGSEKAAIADCIRIIRRALNHPKIQANPAAMTLLSNEIGPWVRVWSTADDSRRWPSQEVLTGQAWADHGQQLGAWYDAGAKVLAQASAPNSAAILTAAAEAARGRGARTATHSQVNQIKKTVKETAQELGAPEGVPWWVWGVAGVGVWLFLVRR